MGLDEPGELWALADLESRAARHVTDAIWDYIQGGAEEESTLRANRSAFDLFQLRPRVLQDVSQVDLRTTLLGRPVSAPYFVAPMAYQAAVHPVGEVGLARATGPTGVLTAFSTLSSCALEEIAAAMGAGPRWFQLYLQPDFEVARSLVERAERSGFDAIILTVDAPVLGPRDRQGRSGFTIDGSVPVGNGRDVVPPSRAPALQGATFRLRSEAAATWEIIGALRSVTRLPVVVKGVLTAEDAERAVRAGAAAVIVSNHGGRQLDRAIASLLALPEIARTVADRIEVYLDGGVRRASDVLVALGLGARAVGIGRPFLWALAAGGTAGVQRYLRLLSTELATGMALVGRRTIAEIDASMVLSAPSGPFR